MESDKKLDKLESFLGRLNSRGTAGSSDGVRTVTENLEKSI